MTDFDSFCLKKLLTISHLSRQAIPEGGPGAQGSERAPSGRAASRGLTQGTGSRALRSTSCEGCQLKEKILQCRRKHDKLDVG